MLMDSDKLQERWKEYVDRLYSNNNRPKENDIPFRQLHGDRNLSHSHLSPQHSSAFQPVP